MVKKIVQFKNLKKKFGSNIIYTDLNLDIYKGETLTVMGGSGTGKSVMLKILIGLIKPDGGDVIFNDNNITKYSESKFIQVRKRIAMLFQGGALFDSLNVYENIAYPLKIHFKMKDKEIAKVVAENLEHVNLPGIEKKMPSELSGGMQKRVGLARALATKPEIMLYDEPTTGLDPINVNAINSLIKELQHRLNITSIVVTHDMQSAFDISDRIAFLWDKKIIFEGTVEETQNSKNLKVYNFINGISMD